MDTQKLEINDTMILLIKGRFYTEGTPFMIFTNKIVAEIWLKNTGWKKCTDDVNKHLFEKIIDGRAFFIRMDKILFGG